MTQKEKAKAYDEALEKSKELLCSPRTCFDIEQLTDIFPKLAENEDERIRKNILVLVKKHTVNHERCQMEAYLEKQRELPFVKDVVLGYPGHYFYDGEKMHFCGSPAMEEKQKEQPKEELVYRLNGLMQEYIKEGKDDEEKEHRLKCYRLFWDSLEDANFFEQKEQKEIPLMNGDADLYFDNWIQHNDTTKRGWFEEGIRYAQRLQKEQKPTAIENLAEHIKAEFEGFRNLLKKKGIDYQPTQVYWDDFAKLFVSSARKYGLQKPVEKPSKEDYVKKFKTLCDAYEIKLPNREYDIYHLCKDLHKLFRDIQKPVEYGDDIVEDAEEYTSKVDCGEYGVEVTEAYIAGALRERSKKPVEWSEEDEEALREVKLNLELNHDDMTPTLVGFYERFFNKLKSLRPQQKDDKCISPKEGDIVVNKYGEISVFENWGHHPDGGSFNDKTYFFAKCTLEGDYYDDCDCYQDSEGLRYATPEEIRKIVPYLLKSLPERFNLQPKQEWGEEDENKLNHILEIVHIASGSEASIDEKEELESFLKSLRPSWKPSEEQIEALENSTALTEEQGAALYSLIQDLRKL